MKKGTKERYLSFLHTYIHMKKGTTERYLSFLWKERYRARQVAMFLYHSCTCVFGGMRVRGYTFEVFTCASSTRVAASDVQQCVLQPRALEEINCLYQLFECVVTCDRLQVCANICENLLLPRIRWSTWMNSHNLPLISSIRLHV